MLCVCGHAKDAHAKATMSVPLVATRPPSYVVMGQRNTITTSNPRASYVQDQCADCGCRDFEFDYGDD